MSEYYFHLAKTITNVAFIVVGGTAGLAILLVFSDRRWWK